MKKLNWKSILLSFVAIFSLLLLGACGKSVEKTYIQSINQDRKSDVRITIKHQGDKLISTDSVSTVYYKGAGVSKDEIKNLIASYDEEFKDVKGYSHSAEYKDEYFVEKTTIDYTKADLKVLQEKKLITKQKSSKIDYISYESILKSFKSIGFKEVKNGKFEELK